MIVAKTNFTELPEENPKKTFYRKRIWKWDNIIRKRFFSDELGGFFTVKKVWKCVEYAEHALTPGMSHWFDHYTVEVKMDNGEVFIVKKIMLDLEHAFDKEYPKRKIVV